jgi:hypothetical protein
MELWKKNCEFKATLGYLARPYLKKENKRVFPKI